MIKRNIFGAKLFELRKQTNYTQRAVANALGVSKRVYAYWEAGHVPSDESHIISICKFFNISADDLFGIIKILKFPEREDEQKRFS